METKAKESEMMICWTLASSTCIILSGRSVTHHTCREKKLFDAAYMILCLIHRLSLLFPRR